MRQRATRVLQTVRVRCTRKNTTRVAKGDINNHQQRAATSKERTIWEERAHSEAMREKIRIGKARHSTPRQRVQKSEHASGRQNIYKQIG